MVLCPVCLHDVHDLAIDVLVLEADFHELEAPAEGLHEGGEIAPLEVAYHHPLERPAPRFPSRPARE